MGSIALQLMLDKSNVGCLLLPLCVHPDHRGGVYPQGDDVKQLAIRLAKAGFSQEEADHQGVCVQEPLDASVAVSYAQYTQQHCQGSDVLSVCFWA